MPSRPLNYTTTISAMRTVTECMQLLADGGASAIAVQYQSGTPCGLSFRLAGPHGPADFTLAANIDGVQAVLAKADYSSLRASVAKIAAYKTREHATRVAWRVIRDWLEAQLAMVDAQMVTLTDVMLPYLEISAGRTLREAYAAGDHLAIEATP